MACVATAPAPARPQGTTAPTARNFDATAIPHESESASNATIEKVIARSSPPDRLKAARATHVLAEKTPTSLSAPRPATTSGDGSKARPELLQGARRPVHTETAFPCSPFLIPSPLSM